MKGLPDILLYVFTAERKDPAPVFLAFHEFLEEHERLIGIQRKAVEELLAQDVTNSTL